MGNVLGIWLVHHSIVTCQTWCGVGSEGAKMYALPGAPFGLGPALDVGDASLPNFEKWIFRNGCIPLKWGDGRGDGGMHPP